MQDDDFLSAMSDVKPLKQDSVKLGQKPSKINTDQAKLRRMAAAAEQQESDALLQRTVTLVGPHDVIGYKSPGVQDGVYKKLRLARYEIDGRLDLHQHTVDQARVALARFIKDSMAYDLRCVLVMPGKGGRDQSGKAILKSHVAIWLEELPEVLAFHSAQAYHGGAGAFYVLLKKSESSKQKNRERHGLR